MADEAQGFLTRWARRKAQLRGGSVAAEPVGSATTPALASAPASGPALPAEGQAVDTLPDSPTHTAEPLPTMADVALLTRDSDFSRFVRGGVDEGVKRAAMKKLFSDPRFNVMDGLDTYIDDYGKPDPIPLSMLRQMNQSKFLRLFDEEDGVEEDGRHEQTERLATATEAANKPDDDTDLRLQQDDAAGQPGPDRGAGT
jgi:hypothetical protein